MFSKYAKYTSLEKVPLIRTRYQIYFLPIQESKYTFDSRVSCTARGRRPVGPFFSIAQRGIPGKRSKAASKHRGFPKKKRVINRMDFAEISRGNRLGLNQLVIGTRG